MVTTPHLGLTLVEQSQAQKEVTVNMALMRIDAVLNSAAISRALATPPLEPQEGDVYIVAAAATDSWAGKDGHVAYFEQIWRFIAPNDGMMLWVQDESAHVVYTSGVWATTGGGGGGESNTGQNANGSAGGVFKQKTAASLIFNNIVAGSNVTVSGGGESGGDIVIRCQRSDSDPAGRYAAGADRNNHAGRRRRGDFFTCRRGEPDQPQQS
jgi:hypothetical protein